MKKKAGITDKLLEIRRRPREALDLMTGAEYEARDMRWTDELCTYYLGDPEVKILHIRRNEDPEIYDHARRMGQIYGARAFQEHLRSRRRTFEADVRARYPGVDITFVESVRGLSVFAYRSDDVRGELLGAIETSEF